MLEDIDLPKDTAVLVVIPKQEDERELCSQLQGVAELSSQNSGITGRTKSGTSIYYEPTW